MFQKYKTSWQLCRSRADYRGKLCAFAAIVADQRKALYLLKACIVLNILILNYEYPPLGGGAGAVTRTMAEGLAASGHGVTVITTWYEGEEEDHTEGLLRIVRLRSRRKKLFRSNPREMLSWARLSIQYLKGADVSGTDFCIAHFSIPGGEVAMFLKKRYGIPYMVISHGHDIPWFFPRQMFFYHLLTWLRIKTICSEARHLVLLSDDMMENARKFLGHRQQHKRVLIANAFEEKMFSPDHRKRSKVFTILFACRLVQQKDPMTFLQALESIRNSGLVFRAQIIGDGPMRAKMEEYCKKSGLSGVVDFTGWLSKSEVARAYRCGHVFVSTSLQEGMSVAILEAMASGLYVFATPVSNTRLLLAGGVNGEIIPCRSPEMLASALEEYFRNKFAEQYRIPQDVLSAFREKYRTLQMIKAYEALGFGYKRRTDGND